VTESKDSTTNKESQRSNKSEKKVAKVDESESKAQDEIVHKKSLTKNLEGAKEKKSVNSSQSNAEIEIQDSMDVVEEVSNNLIQKGKSKTVKNRVPLPVEVLESLVRDEVILRQVEEKASKKRAREEIEAEVEESKDELLSSENGLDDLHLPSDDNDADLEGDDEEDDDGEPAAKKPKTYGLFDVVALDGLKDGTEIDAKVKQFLRGHFWGDRIPRSDPRKFFSERIQYGPALNFADDAEVDSLEELMNDEEGIV
jgi:hypothetical protein